MKDKIVGVMLLTIVLAALTLGANGADIVRWGHNWFSSSNPSHYLNASGMKIAHPIVPERNMSVNQIAVFCTAPQAGTPAYRIGVQGDDGSANHYPDGTWVGGAANYASTDMPASNNWCVVSLPSAATLTAGTRYHLLVETVSADAGNYRATFRSNASPPRPFRVNDGIYDTVTGMETNGGFGWGRNYTFPIVAVDTSVSNAVGQPWTGQTTIYRISNTTARLGQVFTLAAPGSSSGSFYLRAMGMHVSYNNVAPIQNDNLRIHFLRLSDNTELSSMVLMYTNNLQTYSLIMTNLATNVNVMVQNGQQYVLFCEATNCNNNYYLAIPCNGATTHFVGAGSATFQGTNGYFASSTTNGPWAWKSGLSGCDSDVAFELQLEPIATGTLIMLK